MLPPPSSDAIRRLLEQSLIAWGLIGRVSQAGDGTLQIQGLGREVTIAPAPPGLPFRWMVTVDGRRRPALSVITVLRHVRTALDPGWEPKRIRIGAGGPA